MGIYVCLYVIGKDTGRVHVRSGMKIYYPKFKLDSYQEVRMRRDFFFPPYLLPHPHTYTLGRQMVFLQGLSKLAFSLSDMPLGTLKTSSSAYF